MKFSKFLISIFIFQLGLFAQAAERPNILWFVVDDMSANFSCYGEKVIKTPHVDQLAREGLRFTRAYATSPVCSTFRSALITGMYQTTIGSHHHRSGRGEHRIQLPEGVRPIPEIFQEAGYFTCNGSGLPGIDQTTQALRKGRKPAGKTDYNFDWNPKMYDSHDWAGRKTGQPFFMQVQLHGGKLRGASEAHYKRFDAQVKKLFGETLEPSKVTLPPYYPRDPVLLKDWSTYLDSVRVTDHHVGLVMKRLREEGLLENTLVVFFTDHGISHARGKQFLYDEGTHIPLVLRGPGIPKGEVRKDLVEHIDIAAFSLSAAGIPIPKAMQGKNILSSCHQPKEAVFGARDRCGEAAGRIRSVRSGDYLYIRNFYPQRPHLMPSNYKDSKLILQRLRQLRSEGKLSKLSKELLFAKERPSEELYLYGEDPWQVKNLAEDPSHSAALKKHRQLLDQWIETTNDPGPETLEVYQMEIDDQLKSTGNPRSRENYRRNSELYKKWFKEGK